jgi:hypothetical protein
MHNGVMRIADAAAMITETVEREGLLLVHDRMLPSVTALIAGEPVLGSWWSHPLANLMYNALGAVEDRVASCKLVNKKLTLVAPRLWAGLVSVGGSKQLWQLDGLSQTAMDLLDRVESSSLPVVLDLPEFRDAGRRLEERLLASGDEVHTDAGHHLKALVAWSLWMKGRGVNGPLPKPESAMARFEEIVRRWGSSPQLLPWPKRDTAD